MTHNDAAAEQKFVKSESDVLREERAALNLGESQSPSALCLSGGGVRSAAFCLGALRPLAGRKLLCDFDYLSTVSGGGYIGGWLTRCIEARGITAVESNLLAADGADEPAELRQLRANTNYLTPNPGLASNDTWAGVVLWIRNTLINQAVFLPLLLAAAAVPIFYQALVCVAVNIAYAWFWSVVCGLAALAALAISIFRACLDLPSHTVAVTLGTRDVAPATGATPLQILHSIILPALGWAFVAVLAVTPFLGLNQPGGPAVTDFWRSAVFNQDPDNWRYFLPAAYWFVCLGAFAAACFAVKDPNHRNVFWKNAFAWVLASAISALVLTAGVRLATGSPPLWVAILGPIWVLAAEMIRVGAYVALRRGGICSDLDREWLARVSGNKLRFGLMFTVAAAVTLELAVLIFQRPLDIWNAAAAVAGIASGPAAALLGKSASTPFSYGVAGAKKEATPFWQQTGWIIAIATTVFIVTVFVVLGRFAAYLGTSLAVWPTGGATFTWLAICMAIVIGIACGVAFFADWAINLNRFSMHAVYRNRLVRAFLGSARARTVRHPDLYTSFDPCDNIRMAETFGRREKKLFPVINVALNVTTGKDTARAERKAESFTITPLHCGSPALHKDPDGLAKGAYVDTCTYAGHDREMGLDDKMNGLTLGTAMTISGAAASPNMGDHSSPLVAFVMTLFNVRLGAWLPNPGWLRLDKDTANRSGPKHAIPTMLKDLLGQSDDAGEYIYLSDGGHFDNLGLYEMLRRRCGQMIVIDAGCDPDYAYFDLGHALQRARIDMGIAITFKQPIQVGDLKLDPRSAYATVAYPPNGRAGAPKGEILYLKPWLPPDTPVELAAFKALKESFPHVTTADQFFTESDFESYRRLGEFLMDAILDQSRTGTIATLPSLFAGFEASMGIGNRPDEW